MHQNLVIIGSDNDVLPILHQVIVWINASMSAVWPFGTNVSEIWIEIQQFSFMKMNLKVSSVKWPQCFDISHHMNLLISSPTIIVPIICYILNFNAYCYGIQSLSLVDWLLPCTTFRAFVRDNHAPDSKVHVANMGPTWVLTAPGGPHVGPMNLAIRGRFRITKHHQCNISLLM